MKNHKINFLNKVEEKKITEEEFIPLLGLKKEKKKKKRGLPYFYSVYD